MIHEVEGKQSTARKFNEHHASVKEGGVIGCRTAEVGDAPDRGGMICLKEVAKRGRFELSEGARLANGGIRPFCPPIRPTKWMPRTRRPRTRRRGRRHLENACPAGMFRARWRLRECEVGVLEYRATRMVAGVKWCCEIARCHPNCAKDASRFKRWSLRTCARSGLLQTIEKHQRQRFVGS